MDVDVQASDWRELDEWWMASIESPAPILQSSLASVSNSETIARDWECIDPWWNAYIESQHEALRELQEVLTQAQESWRKSPSSFDADPLAVDWASATRTTGPLRLNHEENWSHWLAHLLRSGPPEFTTRLIGQALDSTPESVEREVYLPDTVDYDRYADILAFYPKGALSIEVKLGDEHYEKTPHTVSLVETQYPRSWTHILLLPARKMDALRDAFPTALTETDDGTIIKTTQSQDIVVKHWLDISRAIRDVLALPISHEPHWEASAYLLCTLIEQKIAHFVPKPVIDRIVTASDVVQHAGSIQLVRGGIDAQLTYLRETTTTTTNQSQ